jgi:DNA repair photolyase
VAPLIPGLNDGEMVAILEAARTAGASRAGLVFLRLPGSTAAVFEGRLRSAIPMRAERVLARVRESQGGRLYDARFGSRGRAVGEYGTAIRALFDATVKRLGFTSGMGDDPPTTTFERPNRIGQLKLL